MDKQKCHCCGNEPEVKVQIITLEDGRRAERHVTYDDAGNEVIEIFSEDKRPLKLEKRIVKEHKTVVAKETHQTIRDGEVAQVEVRSLEPDVPLQVRERLGVAEHSKIIEGDYVRKDEIGKIVADGVVAGMQALMEHWEPAPDEDHKIVPSAQAVVENNVAEKKKTDSTVNIVMVVILLAQLAFFGYMFFVM